MNHSSKKMKAKPSSSVKLEEFIENNKAKTRALKKLLKIIEPNETIEQKAIETKPIDSSSSKNR